MNNIDDVIKRFLKSGKFKECSYYKKEECSRKIIKAHSIQNNRYLSILSKDGYVVMPRANIEGDIFEVSDKEIGRKVATTFTGFCQKHDSEIFSEIENRPYSGLPKQNFLFAYRALAHEYHKKREMEKAFEHCIAHERIRNRDVAEGYLEGTRMAMKDLENINEYFVTGFKEDKYDFLDVTYFQIEKPLNFTVSSCFFPVYDLNGDIINDLDPEYNEHLSICFLNIFPENDHGCILFSWPKHDSQYFKDFKDQLLNKTEIGKEICLTNIVATYCENLAISPEYLENMDLDKRKKLFKVMKDTVTSPSEDYKKKLGEDIGINLFD